jgi:hypothetical protein
MHLATFLMLMCTVSLTPQKTAIMTIHNQHPDIELVSPVYFCNYGKRYKYRIKRVHDNTIMKIGFRFDLGQDDVGGIMMYTIRRKSNTRSDHQSSMDPIYAKVIEEIQKMIRLLITWDAKSLGPYANIMLVECDNELVLNEDKLARLYEKINDIRSDHEPPSWLVCDGIALKATNELVHGTDLESKITISQELKTWGLTKPMWIDPERQVLLEMVIYFY